MAELLDGAITLYDGTVELYDGTVTLKDGTLEFKEETDGLENELKDKINDAIRDILGSDFEVISFVSDKNKMWNLCSLSFRAKQSQFPKLPSLRLPQKKN